MNAVCICTRTYILVLHIPILYVQPPMEDSDSFSAKTSDNGDDNNKEEDGVTSVEHCHFFEGVEKLLEVWFTSSSGTRSTLGK